MATVTTRATLDDLLKTDGKAELIGGRIVHFMASGHLPSVVAHDVHESLDDLEDLDQADLKHTAASTGSTATIPTSTRRLWRFASSTWKHE